MLIIKYYGAEINFHCLPMQLVLIFSRFLQFGIYKLANLCTICHSKHVESSQLAYHVSFVWLIHTYHLLDTYPAPSPISWLRRNSPKATRCVLCASLSQRTGRATPDPRLPTHLALWISSHGPLSSMSSPLSWSIWNLITSAPPH